jgi:hypothetical protein
MNHNNQKQPNGSSIPAALLIKLTQGTLRKSCRDKQEEQEVQQKKGCTTDRYRVSKKILECSHVDAISQADSAFRKEYYKLSLPWDDSGYRLISGQHYITLLDTERQYKITRDNLISELKKEYPNLLSAEQLALGTAFNVDDYPDMAALDSVFTTEIHMMPLPTGKDLRISLQQDQQVTLERQWADMARNKVAAAETILCDRVLTVLDKITERIDAKASGSKNPLHNSVLDNAKEIAELIPGLNINGNSRLEAVANKIKTRILMFSPKELKNSPIAREIAKAETANIKLEMEKIKHEISSDIDTSGSAGDRQGYEKGLASENADDVAGRLHMFFGA